jgi:hypothetical protein
VIPARTAGRHRGSRVPTPAAHGSATRAAACLAIVLVVIGVFLAACGPSAVVVPTLAPASLGGSPGASGDAGAPNSTPWPGDAVLGIEALGIADGQIGTATSDLSKGINTEDLALMRKAADGLAGVDVLLPNMTKIRLEPAMRPFADKYEAAIKAISAGGKSLRDAIDTGDSAAIATSTQSLLNGLAMYTALQGELADWIEQMPEQKRMLTQ